MRATLTTGGLKQQPIAPVSDGLSEYEITLTPRGGGRSAIIRYRAGTKDMCLQELKMLVTFGKVEIKNVD